MAGHFSHLECGRAGHVTPADRLVNLCHCGSPLLARYRLDDVRRELPREALKDRPPSLWRYRELLPAAPEEAVVTLGEGMTPLLSACRLGATAGCTDLWIKDESANPTGSFKARGMSVAITMARHRGARALSLPTAGNAGSAAAAYGARAGLPVHVFMPADTPPLFLAECRSLGAHVIEVEGVITDAGRAMAETGKDLGWFDLSTLKEPYRLEGKKTMGFELAEQFDWRLPDVILYPTGGGTGLVGMWKAFDEMEALGWIDSRRPRLYSIQAAGCAPIVRAFEAGAGSAEPFPSPHTFASGLRVPRAVGDFLILRAVRETGGLAVAVDDEAIRRAWREIGVAEGIFAAPEGAATWAGLGKLLAMGHVRPDERIVLFNTGTGLKYAEAWPGESA
ncbi:MAG TPA: threonine synthase [Candidatus Eisenbacteria bacterium]